MAGKSEPLYTGPRISTTLAIEVVVLLLSAAIAADANTVRSMRAASTLAANLFILLFPPIFVKIYCM
jgi:hypothetical protein